MEKIYYLSKNGLKDGPYSLDEIKSKGLSSKQLAWKDGMSDWISVQDMPELKECIFKTPPPTPQELVIKKYYLVLISQMPLFITILLPLIFLIYGLSGGFMSGTDIVINNRNMPYPIYYLDANDAYISTFKHALLFALILTPFMMLIIKKIKK